MASSRIASDAAWLGRKGAFCAFFCFCALLGHAQNGFDTGLRARGLLSSLKAAPEFSPAVAHWLRVRGVEEPRTWWKIGSPGNFWRVWLERRALIGIRSRGQQVCILFMPEWPGGRCGNSSGLPLDLREAFRRAWILGRVYGDVVDAWEISNEPDVGFVPENAEAYAAYLKAVYLGIKLGSESRVESAKEKNESWKGVGPPLAVSSVSTFNRQPSASARAPLVLMAPLALPPGPYCEVLVRNGMLSYTDGFNYHYYGYAEDFSGVYRQFERALHDLTADHADKAALAVEVESAHSASSVVNKSLPVFLTEYGYGLLSRPAAETVAGRVRQWRWFHDVYRQIRDLRIAGPMAFYVPPYFENGTQEFGLTIKSESEPRDALQLAGGGALNFRPDDFGTEAAEPWMTSIGRRIGEATAAPALACLLAEGARKPAAPHDWSVAVPPASPIVIDFVGGIGMLAAKQCQGYFLSGGPGGTSVGAGELRLYNFGDAAVPGRLDVGPLAHLRDDDAGTILLQPGELRIVPVTLRITADDLLPRTWSVRFSTAPAAVADGEFSSQLYANTGGLVRREWSNLAAVVAGEENARRLDSRVRAREEPPGAVAGHWRTSEGLAVTERDGRWSFTVSGFPAEPLRPAMAEWVLPDDFQLPEGSLIEFEYRLVERAAAACAAVAEPRAPTMLGAVDRELISVYWRTQNGNLYTVWQTLMATNGWQRYAQMKGSFSMGFYGRANLPWRFADNRPISLVFTFRPNYLPATFEVKSPAIVVYSR